MLRKFIHRLVPRTHYWRDVGFDELSEIYTSQMLRSLSLSLVSIFVPVYLYSIGYSLPTIFLFFAMFFVVRLPLIPLWAFVVARIGPKHGILLSMVIQIFYLSLLVTLESLRWPLILPAIAGSAAMSLFWVAFHTDFSKVSHKDHAGKELSYVNIFERLGAIIGPLIGGLIANYYDPRYTIFLALLVMVASVFPLLTTSEPVRLKQQITFKGFPYRANLRTAIATTAHDLDSQSSLVVWPLYVSIAIFGQDVFGKLGLMAALSVGLGLLFTRAIGTLIDEDKGRALLRLGTWLNAATYLIRPFITTIGGVFAVNITNDPVTTAFRIPYLKGYHAEADSLEGYRIIFFAVNEWIASFVRAIFWLGLLLAAQFASGVAVMRWQFIVVAIVSLGLLAARFTALEPKKA